MNENLDRGATWIQTALDITPWAAVGLFAVAAAAVLLAYPVGKLLKTNPIIVGLLMAAVGAALIFTLTPHYGPVSNPGGCYLRLSQPARADLTLPTDFSLNILLFVPAGFLIMLLRPWWAVACGLVVAVMIPPAIEWIQMEKVDLGRTCSALDVATNEIGLFIGVAVGLAIRIVWEIVRAISGGSRR